MAISEAMTIEEKLAKSVLGLYGGEKEALKIDMGKLFLVGDKQAECQKARSAVLAFVIQFLQKQDSYLSNMALEFLKGQASSLEG